ncbi:MAG: hypothetical protein JOS17DRAFT_780379 [Linnemannia elongata]|nr:MAG: hypothetical protein JOS17DRAFT_780379 [Linnemannia elongata]
MRPPSEEPHRHPSISDMCETLVGEVNSSKGRSRRKGRKPPDCGSATKLSQRNNHFVSHCLAWVFAFMVPGCALWRVLLTLVDKEYATKAFEFWPHREMKT